MCLSQFVCNLILSVFSDPFRDNKSIKTRFVWGNFRVMLFCAHSMAWVPPPLNLNHFRIYEKSILAGFPYPSKNELDSWDFHEIFEGFHEYIFIKFWLVFLTLRSVVGINLETL